jgi:hypothetical protein
MRIFAEQEPALQRLILRRLIVMRQIVPVALLSALIAVPSALAQRPAGHSGGFASGHFGGSFGRSFSGPVGHSFGGSFAPGRMAGFSTHSFGTAPRMNFSAPGRAFAPESAWRGDYGRDRGGRDRGGRDRGGRYRSPYQGYGYGYGGYPYLYANSWELLPGDLGYSDFMGEDDDTGTDTAQQQPAPESVPPPGDGYRQQYGKSSYEGYTPPPPDYYPSRPTASAAPAPEPQLTLIFKDGHQEAIQNYALTPDSVIVMDHPAPGRQQSIPLAQLNLPATEQAAQQEGLDFTPPG